MTLVIASIDLLLTIHVYFYFFVSQMSKKGIKMSWDPTVKLWYLCADAAKIAEVVGSEDGQLVQVENPHL
jgi:hypothetical protein